MEGPQRRSRRLGRHGAAKMLLIGGAATNLIFHVLVAFAIGLVVGWITAGPAED
jgi:hypothetical protein